MRKSQITIVVQMPLANETDFMNLVIAWLGDQKNKSKIEKADIQTTEIDIPGHVAI
jgi:hypothetical protein